MTEIIQVFTHLILFIFLSSFPVNKIVTPSIYVQADKSLFNVFFLNIIFFLTILLFASFFHVNLKNLFIILIFFYLFLFFLNFSKIIYNIKKIKLELIAIFFLVNLFYFFNIAYNLKLGWDGLGWITKANNFYLGKNYFELSDVYAQYPQLGGYLWAFFWKNSFIDKEYLGRLYYAFLYFTSLFVLVSSFKNLEFLKKVIFLFLLLIFSYDSSLEGYQEYFIFSLLIFCGKLILLLNYNKDKIYLYIFLILATCLLPWIKNEGYFYSIFISFLFFLSKQDQQKKIIFISIVIFNILLQISFIKLIFKLDATLQFSLVNQVYDLLFNNIQLLSFAKKISIIMLYAFHGLLKYPIALLNVFSFILLIKYRNFLPEYKIFIYFLILNIFFIFSIYILTPHDLIWHLQTSIKRLILQTSGFYFFIFIALYNKKILKF
jgi:hypothetical protein